jgi:hypothetical protein
VAVEERVALLYDAYTSDFVSAVSLNFTTDWRLSDDLA